MVPGAGSVEHLLQMVWEHLGKDTASVSAGSIRSLHRSHSIKHVSSNESRVSVAGVYSRRILYASTDNSLW